MNFLLSLHEEDASTVNYWKYILACVMLVSLFHISKAFRKLTFLVTSKIS